MPKLTLTFDNGPDAGVTPHVLDSLARRSIQTTFFVWGKNVVDPARADLAVRALAEGHRVGNHTWSHVAPLGTLPEAEAIAEFERAESALKPILEQALRQEPRLFRPLGGGGRIGSHLLHPAVVDRLTAGGYTCVLWNSVPGDWRDPDGWLDRALADLPTRDWTLMVLHDIDSGAMKHLDRFLDQAAAAGCQFTQDYPPDCLPIVAGSVRIPLDAYLPAK